MGKGEECRETGSAVGEGAVVVVSPEFTIKKCGVRVSFLINEFGSTKS